jgi:hypothetical protein
MTWRKLVSMNLPENSHLTLSVLRSGKGEGEGKEAAREKEKEEENLFHLGLLST